MSVTLFPADEDDIAPIAESMRLADRIEAEAFGRKPHEALEFSLRSSLWALTAFVDGVPHAMLGVAPQNMLTGHGVPWMLGTDEVYRHGRALLHLTSAVMKQMEVTFPILENVVSADNSRAIRFLKFWGWKLSDEVVPIGGVGFRRFANV